jgi:hypothetical protein
MSCRVRDREQILFLNALVFFYQNHFKKDWSESPTRRETPKKFNKMA